MNFIRNMMSRFHHLNAFDISMFKICMIAFALAFAKLVPAVLDLDWGWYGLIFIVTYAWVLVRMFARNPSK